MPRSKIENQRIRNAQRTSILEGAKAVFARKGWATTVSDIALAANVSQGLIYHYFPNKKAIFYELMGQTLKSDPFLFQQILQSEGSPTERMETIISKILKARRENIEAFGITAQLVKDNPPEGNNIEMMRKMFRNLASDDSKTKDLREFMVKRFQSLLDTIEQLIIEGQKSGEFAHDDPSKLANMILRCMESLTRFALEQPDQFKKYYPYTEVIMRMLKPDCKSEGKKEA